MRFRFSDKNPDASVAFFALEAMHSPLEVILVNIEQARAKVLADRIESKLRAMEKLLNRHDAESVFAKINSGEQVRLDDDSFALLKLCELFRAQTEGLFDIACLSGVRISPSYSLKLEDKSIELASPKIILDAGAFGKGYALDIIKAELQQEGVKSALLNFGDSSIASIGIHPFGDCWSVSSRASERSFELRDSSISFSGLKPDGSAHIVNPISGEKLDKDTVVAVQGKSAFICEILSTALYAAQDKEKKDRIISKFVNYQYLEYGKA